MVIESSAVAMSSGRTYKRQTRDRSSIRSWGEVLGAATSPRAQDSRTITQKETNVEAVELYQNYTVGGRLLASAEERTYAGEAKKEVTHELRTGTSKDAEEMGVTVKREATGTMFRRLFSGGGEEMKTVCRPMTLIEFFSLLIRQRQEDFRRFLENYRIGLQGGSSGSMMTEQAEILTVTVDDGEQSGETYSFFGEGRKVRVSASRTEVSSQEAEEEKLRFDTTGTVKTADGREIDFDVSLAMDRRFASASEFVSKNASVKLTDPLVINFDAAGAELTDQRIEFDIDCDGELDNIALLGQACGYLALDINEDGVIGDGSELFGTRSGDGFADLAVYDADENGWIDENDPIFDKLKIWSRGPDGTDHLVGLGVRGIGAICLTRVPTEFSMKNDTGETLGLVRSSGVFLREDGSAGTVQQVDLAKRDRVQSRAG